MKKQASKRKWIGREYHVQKDADVAQKYVKCFCNANQFPLLTLRGPNKKPHGIRGLSKHYHMQFDPKMGHGICAICHIPCDCAACKPMLDKT